MPAPISRPTRRTILVGGAAAALARPALAQGARATTLRFVPQADVTILDPLNTTAYATRTHGHMCWDTLYGVDAAFVPQPQLAEGHVVEDEGRRWTFTLRDGPTFHDGERVLARDAVASIRRWMPRDTHGQTLAQRLDAIEVLDDRRFAIRLKRPFGPLLDALAKSSSYPCFVYPERFAQVDPARGFTEVVGSGPYRFMAGERISGAQVVYERYERYVPTPVGGASLVAGPKRAGFARQEWKILNDAGTASAAVQSGEIDWWESVASDLEPLMRSAKGVRLAQVDSSGICAALRFNQLVPPFDDPAARRALLSAVDQADFMAGFAGEDRTSWRSDLGFFSTTSPFASDAGMAALTGPRDAARANAALAATGKAGAKVTALHATDVANQNAFMLIAVDMMRRSGLEVDDATSDWGTLLARRANRLAGSGSWNALIALFSGADMATPAGNLLLRGNGKDAWFGWPEAPEIERLRDTWFDAPDLAAQRDAARRIQVQAFADVPYIPLGQYFTRTAIRSDIVDVREGMVLPLNARRG